MAAPANNLLSLRHRTQNKNTFTKQQQHDVKRRAMHLQLYLQELKDRELRAQENNSQLLQQFEEAQVALKEMLARTAAMKTIRREYERYLEDNSSHWQQQLQQQTQAAQIKRTVDSVSSYLRKTEENQALACTVDTSLLSQGPLIHKSVAPQVCSTQENSNYGQDNSSYHPYTQSSWLTSSFQRASHQSHNPLLSPPHTFLHPHSFLPQHFTFMPGHQQPQSRQDDAGKDPEPCAAGIPPEEPPASRVPQTGEEREKTSGVPSSNREHDGGNVSRLSPDLDIKPVRLLSRHAGSSESDRDSSLVCREETKREKRGRTQQSSSDSASHTSQKTTFKTATASFLRPQSSESDTSSEEGNPVPDASLQSEEEAKEQTKRDEEEESQHTSASEKVGDQSHADESESSGSEQESGRSDRKNKTGAAEETDDQEQSSVNEKDGDKLKNAGSAEQEDTDNTQNERQGSDEEEDDYDDEVSLTGKSEEEAEVRMEDQTEEKKQGSASSQEEEDESSEDEEGSHDEDQGEETGEESGDSEDVIISPQKRPEQIQIISEGAEDEENKTQSSKEISDEDIEDLLVPQRQTEEMDLKANEEPKVIYHNMDIFQVAKEKSKTGNKSVSDEFDHFYD